MKFKKIIKRKLYQTWQHKNRKTGLWSFIYYINNDDCRYYFSIVCFNNKCGLNYPVCIKEKCGRYVYYNSLDEGLFFKSFDECREAVIKWHKNHG